MKRLYVAFVLVLFTYSASALGQGSQAGTELVLGSWNIRDFSLNSRNADELRQIATVAHKMDCMAICELNDTNALAALATDLGALGGAWQGVHSPTKVGNSKGTAEYYGFVYRSDKLKVRNQPRVLDPVTLAIPAESAPYHFDRRPFVCSFSTLDGRFDFTMMVVHITWGDKESHRIAEIRALKDYYFEVQRADKHDQDVMVCGDFNRNVGDVAFDALLKFKTMVDTTTSNVPTTIDTTNTYDHILFQTKYLTEYTGNHGVERFDETMFGGDNKKANLACSDHRPVWIIVTVPEKDDD